MRPTIGVDIGGTKCLGVVVDGAGQVVAEHRLATPRTGPDLVSAVGAVVAELRPVAAATAAGQGHGGRPLLVGIGAPGLVDGDGTLRFAPNLPGVVELALRDRLTAGPLADAVVVVDNDANCATWAESVMGAGVGGRDVLMATIGTGIGGGRVSDGRLQRGHHGFAGEIGHMMVDPNGPRCPCGKQGCWERYASGSGLGWMGREAAQAGVGSRMAELAGGDPEAVRGEHVTVAAAEGDEDARLVMARFAWWLALGLANLANALDPELIVLGGGMVESGAVVLDPAREAFASLLEGAGHRPVVPLVAAVLGERAGAIGAALLARLAGGRDP